MDECSLEFDRMIGVLSVMIIVWACVPSKMTEVSSVSNDEEKQSVP